MLSIRRKVTYLGLAACIAILLTRFQRLFTSSDAPRLLIESFADPDTGRLRWDLIPVRYPVESIVPLPTAPPQELPKVQHKFARESSSNAAKRQSRRDAVKKSFERCWVAYREHAWMKDELAPTSGFSLDPFGGWAATLVDSLDTLWIMGMRAEFEEATAAAMDIDLSSSTINVINVFETNIRHLGGFLAAYDLSGDQRLLQKAKEFGDMLIVAFDTPNRLPITRWRAFTHPEDGQIADANVLIAEIGSLSLEFTRLSQLTDDPKWYDAIVRIVRILDEQQFKTNLPGMWPVSVNAREGNFTKDSLFTLGAMADSLYEYFPKMHALLGGVDPVYRKLYSASMATAIKHTLWRPLTPDNADVLIAGQVRKYRTEVSTNLAPQGQHLVCFAGGMLALGGKLFNIPTHLDIAKKLVDGCIWTYRALPRGIMPEVFRMAPCDSRAQCRWNETKWLEGVLHENPGKKVEETIENKHLPPGFTHMSDRRYLLRPEAIESVFLLYRITGENYLLDAAWDMFSAITNATETPLANTVLSDVTSRDAPSIQSDSMESFWMAETLKYFYLIFSEPELISLDEYVFNTEAHPFKRRLPN